MKKVITACVLLLIVLNVNSLVWGQSQRPENVKIDMIGFIPGTPLQVDSETMAMALMREYPDWKVLVRASRKGPAGIMEVREKKAVDMFVQLSAWKLEKAVYPKLYKHLKNYEKEMSYQALAPHSVRPVHFLVLEDTGLESIKDMIDKKFPARAGYVGIGYEFLLEKILEYYGATLSNIKEWGGKFVMDTPVFPTGADIMKQKGYNVAVVWVEAPHPLLIDIHNTVGLRMLPFEEGCRDFLVNQLGLSKTIIPAALYKFLQKDYPTVQFDASICAVTGKLSDDMAYYITKGLWNQRKFIAAESRSLAMTLVIEKIEKWNQALIGQDLTIHPGALRYYREQGWIN